MGHDHGGGADTAASAPAPDISHSQPDHSHQDHGHHHHNDPERHHFDPAPDYPPPGYPTFGPQPGEPGYPGYGTMNGTPLYYGERRDSMHARAALSPRPVGEEICLGLFRAIIGVVSMLVLGFVFVNIVNSRPSEPSGPWGS